MSEKKLTDLKNYIYEKTKESNEDIILYHYTDSNGLLSIVETGIFYASHFLFFNDPSELKYGINMINKRLKEKNKQETNDSIKSELNTFSGDFDNYENIFQQSELIFVLSFSEEGDLLSQWRAYGDDGKGYSIGIKKSNILTNSGIDFLNKSNTLFLVKIIYNPEIQNEIGTKLYEAIVEDIENNRDYKKTYFKFIVLLGMIMKHPAYSEEKEWRIIYKGNKFGDNEKIISHKVSGSDIVSYIKLGFDEQKKSFIFLSEDITKHDYPLPLEKIYKGPAIENKSIKMLFLLLFICQNNKSIIFHDISDMNTICSSKCPYRNK